jgi:hypothetical protein
MEHGEAIQQMIAERYLLDELTPEAREAFEEHLFDCPECAVDLRAGVAFVMAAKEQLPNLASAVPAFGSSRSPESRVQRAWRFNWLQMAIGVPVFATLLLVLGYQNLVTYPGLRASANQPRLLPWSPLLGATRGRALMTITADSRHGVALPIDLPPQPIPVAYVSYCFDLYDPQGKLAWTGVAASSNNSDDGGQRLSLVIPGAMLREGAYSLVVSGTGPQGERTVIERYAFDLHLTD